MRRLIPLLLLLLCASPAFASITPDGTCSGTTSCTPSAAAVGTIQVAFAYRSASRTAPSTPSTWQTVATVATTTGGTVASMKVACRVSTSATPAASGTFTNATNLGISGYDGTGARVTKDCASVLLGIGGSASDTAKTSTTVSYDTISMSNSSGSSWVIGAMGANTSGNLCTPSGMTNIAGATTGVIAVADTGAGVTGWSTTTCGITSDTWISYVLEILAPAANPATLTNLVSSTNTMSNAQTEVGNYFRFYFGDPGAGGALAGNLVVVGITYPSSVAAPTLTDDQGTNTWVDALDCTSANGTTPFKHSIFYSLNTAAGTHLITATFASASENVQATIQQFSGIVLSSAVDGTPVCGVDVTGTQALNSIQSGAITTTSDGDLIYNYVVGESGGNFGNINVVDDIVFGTGFSGLYGDTNQTGSAAQAMIQTTHGSVNPGMMFSQAGGANVFSSLSIAFKTDPTKGTAGSGFRVIRQEIFEPVLVTGGLGNPYVFPCDRGNLIISADELDSSSSVITVPNDSNGNAYTKVSGSGYSATLAPQIFYSPSATCSSGLFGRLISSTGTNTLHIFYEVAGAATSSPLDTGGTGPVSYTSVSLVVATTTTQSRVAGDTTVTVAAAGGISNGDYLMWGPANGADQEVIQVTSGGGTTTLTIARAQRHTVAASHASGENLIETNIAGPTFTPSATGELVIMDGNQGTGPYYDVSGCQYDFVWYFDSHDGDAMNNGDNMSHCYTTSTASQAYTWIEQNHGNTSSIDMGVALFKPAPATAGTRHRGAVINQ